MSISDDLMWRYYELLSFKSNEEIEPTLINPGDKVLFYEISKKEFLNLNNE